MALHPFPGRLREPFLLALTREGQLAEPEVLARLAAALPAATDCFVFCHGWLHDRAETRAAAARFFALLEGVLRPLAGVVTVRVALHWPSKPFAEDPAGPGGAGQGEEPELFAQLDALARRAPGRAREIVLALAEAEVPHGAEEALELAALRARLRASGRARGLLSPLHALSLWVMKRRAGAVGERLGRAHLAPLLASLGERAPRLHLIGHSFGAKLVTAAVLAGCPAESVTLLLGALSAFAFADEVPGTDQPGYYRPVVAERRVRGPVAVLFSAHDRALGSLYPAMAAAAPGRGHGGRHGHVADVVAGSALGAVGARGVGAPEVDLTEVLRIGLPARPVVNVNGGRVVRASEWLVGAHRDIQHPEIATLIGLAAGLLEPGPEGLRVPRRHALVSR